MYCSSCGGAVARDLSYCSHCGAALGGANGQERIKTPELFPDSLVWAIVSVFVVGLGGTIGLMAVMKDVFGSSNPGLIIAFSLLVLLLTLAVEAVLISLLLMRRRRGVDEVSDAGRLKQQMTKELDAAKPRALPDPLPSVTEHTTRTFEPIYSERKAE